MKFTSLIVLAAASPIAATRPFGVSVPAGRSTSVSQSTTTSSSCNILDIRGGAVHESSTLSDLESRIQSAALQDKLTVVDFTATW